MAYYVRLLTSSEKMVPFSEIQKQGQWIKLVSGTDPSWNKIEVREPSEQLISIIERHLVSGENPEKSELENLKHSIQDCYPVNAREWLKQYFAKVKTVYTFQLFADVITGDGWPVLGRVQNLLKDTLAGIIQADKEGFYNEDGDYILWQMYEGASGTIPAATLDEKEEWISYQLRLNDARAVDQFKQGIPPGKGFLGRLFGTR